VWVEDSWWWEDAHLMCEGGEEEAATHLGKGPKPKQDPVGEGHQSERNPAQS
jgi:hypothetical protein